MTLKSWGDLEDLARARPGDELRRGEAGVPQRARERELEARDLQERLATDVKSELKLDMTPSRLPQFVCCPFLCFVEAEQFKTNRDSV